MAEQELTQDQVRIKELEKEVATLTKQLDEHAPEAIYSVNVDRLTVRSRPGEPLARYWERVDAAISQAKSRGLVRNEQTQPQSESLPKRDPTLTQNTISTETHVEDDETNAMEIAEAAIVSDRNGLPQLELYQNGHKFPDLRYSLGKDETTRKANLAKMLGTMPQAIAIGWKQNVNWKAHWKTGRDPKYKDLVSISKAAQ